MSSLVENLTIEVEGKEIICNKERLIESSSYFSGMFSVGMRESELSKISLLDTDYKIMLWLINYTHQNVGVNVTLNEDNAQNILRVANKYQFTEVEKKCCLFLMESMTIKNVITSLQLAETFWLTDLRRRCNLFSAAHFDELLSLDIARRDMLELSLECMVMLVSCDVLNVRDEREVAKLCIEWLDHNHKRFGGDLTTRNRDSVDWCMSLLRNVKYGSLDCEFIKETFLASDVINNSEITVETLRKICEYKVTTPSTRCSNCFICKATIVNDGDNQEMKIISQKCPKQPQHSGDGKIEAEDEDKDCGALCDTCKLLFQKRMCKELLVVGGSELWLSTLTKSLHQYARDHASCVEYFDTFPALDLAYVDLHRQPDQLQFLLSLQQLQDEHHGPDFHKLAGYQICSRGHNIYVIGGELGLGRGAFNKVVWQYNIISERWSSVGELSDGCRHFSVGVVGECVYLVGGFSANRLPQRRVRSFNLLTGVYEVLESFHCPSKVSGLVSSSDSQLFIISDQRLGVCDVASHTQTWCSLPPHHPDHPLDYCTICYHDRHIYLFCSLCASLYKWKYEDEASEITVIGHCESKYPLASGLQNDLTRGSELCSKDMICVCNDLLCVIIRTTSAEYLLLRYDLSRQKQLGPAITLHTYAEMVDSCAHPHPYPASTSTTTTQGKRVRGASSEKVSCQRSHRISFPIPGYISLL